jgi:ketosteroid isomerase-like protein
MKNAFNLALFALLLISSCRDVLAQKETKQTLEQEIRKLDLAEAQAILKKDFRALDELSSADFTTNSPRGEIVKGKEALKGLIRTGVIDYASFVREIETVLIHDKTAVTMGRETIVMGEKTPQKGQTVRRRYTNIWIKRNGKWLLTARHANVICG